MLAYRKAKDGSWAVSGPVSELHIGEVTVHKRDGTTKQEHILSLSKPFDVNGVLHVIGEVDRTRSASQYATGPECTHCGRKTLPSKFRQDDFYCPSKECRDEHRKPSSYTSHGAYQRRDRHYEEEDRGGPSERVFDDDIPF